MTDLTREQIEKALPATLKGAATQELTDKINTAVSDPLVADQIRENFISYSGILRDGKYRTDHYLKAVIYVSFKLMSMSNLDAYMRTFPKRYADLLANGTSSKDIAAYVSAYNKGKIVNAILEQALVPSWLLNQENYQKAINTQVELMMTAQSEKVRSDAANSILTHLKRPEAVKAEISLELKENSGMNELKKALGDMAQQQRELISQGVPTALIAAKPIVEAEFDEVEATPEANP